ncbi:MULTISPECIES: hypothetical protein [Peribacillus]
MGVNESLIITKNAALIVSPKNNMVITVMNREEATSQNLHEHQRNHNFR